MGWDRFIELRYGFYFEGDCFKSIANQLYNINTEPKDMLLKDAFLDSLSCDIISTKEEPSRLWILHKTSVEIVSFQIFSRDRYLIRDIDGLYPKIIEIDKYRFDDYDI
jgi:hypothetical protein